MNASLEQINTALNNCGQNSPYLLENESEYQDWRARKLQSREELPATKVFELNSQGRLQLSMLEPLRKQVAAYNFVIF